MRERPGVDGVRLHAGGGDRLRPQWVGEVQLVAFLLEQIGQPFPAVGRLERDLRVIAQFVQEAEEDLRVVDDAAREQLSAVLIEDGDLRALAVEINPDVHHHWASFGPDFDNRPRHTASGAGALGGPLRHDINWWGCVSPSQGGRCGRAR
jgi:hypothetical protein